MTDSSHQPMALSFSRSSALWIWSIAWSIEPDRSWDYANRAFVYLAFALFMFASVAIDSYHSTT